MRNITIDRKALRFNYSKGGTNVFWRDLLRWPKVRFWSSLKGGLKLYLKG